VWSIAPNPSDDFIQVKIDPSMKVEVLVIHDLAGRSVKTWSWNGINTMNLDIQDLPAGSYFLLLKSKYASWSRKIVVQ
jgi:hypothetical protein